MTIWLARKTASRMKRTLTSFPLLIHSLRHLALDCLGVGVDLEVFAGCSCATAVHGTLKRVSLPAEDVVTCWSVSYHRSERQVGARRHTVLPIAGSVSGAQIEGLDVILGPFSLVVEGRGVPHNLWRRSESPGQWHNWVGYLPPT